MFVALLSAREAIWAVGGTLDLPHAMEMALLIPCAVLLVRLTLPRASALARLAPVPALAYVIIVRAPELTAALQSGEIASHRAAILSTLESGLPIASLAAAVGLLFSAAGWAQRLAESESTAGVPKRVCAVSLGLHFALGLAALLSYGAGSPIPFAE